MEFSQVTAAAAFVVVVKVEIVVKTVCLCAFVYILADWLKIVI